MVNRSRGTAPSATPPRALVSGSRVALVAPAGPLEPERIDLSMERCRELELEPVLSPSARERRRFLAGTDDQRHRDLQRALDDPSIDGVWALRGGYGTQRIVDRLDLSRQREDPIPFIGFSDNTALHVRHAATEVISFHGPHPGADFPPESREAFRRVLFFAEPPGRLPLRDGDPPPATLVEGTAEGPLFGGNLSILASLCGTQDAPSARGRILLLEDVAEAAYKVDRMLLQLRRAGALEGVLGLALGRFTPDPDDDEHAVPDVLAEYAEALDVPAVIDLPFGHVEHNWTLPVGGMARLDAGAGTLELTEPAVRSG